MKRFEWLGMAVLAIVLGVTGGCGEPSYTSIEGAWLGEGEFRVSRGAMDVKAQLELLSDGTYRYLILEPGILMLTGMETGRWTHEGTTLTLTPIAEEPDDDDDPREGNPLRHLRSPEAVAARGPRSYIVSDNLGELRFRDSKLELTFTRNDKATQDLRSRGEIE